jgi:peptide/nickel transport system substrate-binding protein/oligopeptide transport system substrate-binding protein
MTLDAVQMTLWEDFLLAPLIHQTLLDVQAGTNLVTAGARAWTTSSDKRIYTCWLRPGVRFSNGREVVASDYAFSLERTLNPATTAMLSV